MGIKIVENLMGKDGSMDGKCRFRLLGLPSMAHQKIPNLARLSLYSPKFSRVA